MGNDKYASINDGNKQLYIDKLKKFIERRINYILEFPFLHIPLKSIVRALSLSLE